MPHPLIVTKGSQGANARIKQAVWKGRGWRYAHEGTGVVHTATAGGLTKQNLYKYPNHYEMKYNWKKGVHVRTLVQGRVVSAAKRAAGKQLKRDYGAENFV
jgi:hypothetical protein